MAMILDFFVTRYLEKLANFVEGEACKVLGVKEEINKLKRRLARIRGFLQDAERKRTEDAVIDTWVRELKDLIYDADDIIDLCMFQGGKLLEAQPSASGACFPLDLLSSCFKCTKYRHDIASRIKELNDRLKEIAEDRLLTLRLEYSNQVPQDNRVSSRETSFVEVKSDIVGTQIEYAARNLINRIIQNDKQQKCRVFGIVGMGGIGKTTLARKIFNDEKIKDNFPICIWLYVSKNYSEIELLKKIIRGAGGNDDGANSRAELESKLVSLLSRNLFLVLDDTWSADVWWHLLRNPIISGAASSKIIVTTRAENVASSMRVSYIHQVKKMDEETGWDLLCKIIFEDKEQHEIARLEDIGIRIIKKCDGLPLAIKVIAGVLISKERSRFEWEKIVETDLWRMDKVDKEELPRALYLSYEDLPFHLKQCFLYCCLLPTNTSYDLVQFWMAEDFIIKQGDRLMEEIGDEYYRELIWRNLLQPDPKYVDGSQFSMHDLLRSLGANLMEGEGICINDDHEILNRNPLTKIRRLSTSNEEDTLKLPGVVMEQGCLRALIVVNSGETKTIQGDVLERIGHLRVLDLSGTSMESLPDSIGGLLHLRYLCLEGTDIREIPESIGRLANLQTLSVADCESMHGLPKAITSLHNLRCLDLSGTPLTHVPRGIGRLKNLNQLRGFVVGHEDESSTSEAEEGCDLKELHSLSNLTILSICRLELAMGGASVLTNKRMLRKLSLEWTSTFPAACSSEEQIQNAEKIFNELCPPSSLQILQIQGFPGRRLPGWMMSTMGDSFPDLAYLDLLNCESCIELPPLGQLPQLKFLRVARAEAIKTIGPEFLGSPAFPAAPAFPKLDYMEFTNMPNWEEWPSCAAEKVDAGGRNLQLLPNLSKCFLIDCPKLRALPDSLRHATNLENLIIRKTSNVREISDLRFLRDKLEVTKMERLRRISNLPLLKYLEIDVCPSLEYVENLDALQRLLLALPPHVEHLPNWLSGLIERHRSTPSTQPSFQKFELHCGLSLLNSCLKGEVNWHTIQQIPEVQIRTIDGRFLLYTKDPHMYETNAGSE